MLCVKCTTSGALDEEVMHALWRRTRNLGESLLLVSFVEDADAAPPYQDAREKPRRVLVAGVPAEARRLFAPEGTLVLVDARLQVRGFYPRGDLDDLLRD